MTAVEWFAKQVLRSRQLGFISNEKFNELLEQAKEMDEKEKIDFADKYGTYLLQGGIMSAAAYNETFKQE